MPISLLFFANNKTPSSTSNLFTTQKNPQQIFHSAAVMKKLYKKGTVHPTPPPVSDQLAFLPAAILTLTMALSQEDKEVLAYLISCSSVAGGAGAGADHPPCFNCNCFRCYMSYWVRWDTSPNRQLIHEIIDAYEDGFQLQSKKLEKNKREKRRNKTKNCGGNKRDERAADLKKKSEEQSMNRGDFDEPGSPELPHRRHDGGGEDGNEEEEGGDKGAVRRFVSFIGDRIWTSIWT